MKTIDLTYEQRLALIRYRHAKRKLREFGEDERAFEASLRSATAKHSWENERNRLQNAVLDAADAFFEELEA